MRFEDSRGRRLIVGDQVVVIELSRSYRTHQFNFSTLDPIFFKAARCGKVVQLTNDESHLQMKVYFEGGMIRIHADARISTDWSAPVYNLAN